MTNDPPPPNTPPQPAWRQWLKDAESPNPTTSQTALRRLARVLYPVAVDLAEGDLMLRASGLVYTTLLSLVPLIAVSFSVLKGFGVHNQLEPLLHGLLLPLGEQGQEITRRLIGFVDNMRVGALGSLGLAMLFYTVVSLVQKMEEAFNRIWNVRRNRPLFQRFSNYLSVIIVGPVLIFAAIGMSHSLLGSPLARWLLGLEPVGGIRLDPGPLLPFLLISGALSFFYLLVPNTRVQPKSALVGGLTAGLLWEGLGWLFAAFISGSTSYTAVYSAFASLIVFMIWLHLVWLILLIGAAIAYHHQNPQLFPGQRRGLAPSVRQLERLGFLAMLLVGRNHYQKGPPWSLEAMARQVRAPMEMLEKATDALEADGLLVRTRDEPPRFLPGVPLDETTAAAVLAALRRAGEQPGLNPGPDPADPALERLLAGIDATLAREMEKTTLKTLALDGATAPPEPVNT